jgi:phosphatidylglycerol lysyltransferase
MPLYADAGFSFFKVGEEAGVSLAGFSLEGPERRDLRYVHRKLQKLGYVFDVAPREAVPALLPALREISDAWLKEKSAGEKSFSLGRFDDDYMREFPVAIVRDAGGRSIAFANLWPGDGHSELSIDLMRYRPDAANGIMDYLFICIMLWGAAKGYARFSLGMAPLAGLGTHPLSPLWTRLGAWVFRHGEHFYNFQGLRQYKDKFAPEWRPRYVASLDGTHMPRVLFHIAELVGGGLPRTLFK